MSAFLVSNSTISKLADAIKYFDKKFYEKYSSVRKLARDLYDLNVWALEERYEDPSDMISEFEYEPVFFNLREEKGLAQFYMSLCCFLYQCTEGKVVDSKLYKELKRVRRDLADKIAIEWSTKCGAEWE